MRSPEHRKPYQKRQQQPGHTYNEELNLRYLAPGAFTILPPEDVPPQDPPLAPQPYRLTPQSKRHKNLAFAILAEPSDSRPGSRSPSPSGRVSPFRGRGFNPAGSRHASPAPSPPPPDDQLPASNYHHHQHHHQSSYQNNSNNNNNNGSKIPKLSRRGSVSVFGEKIADFQTSPNKRKQLSQSLNNIDNAGGGPSSRRTGNATTGGGSSRPPPSPRRPQGYKPSAFQRLSPIAGSSPEPSQQSQSSPSRIPKTRSQPQSRFTSPTRNQSTRPPRSTSRPVSRAPSRSGSREASPGTALSPVRKSYRNIQAKVNSFNSIRPKPKVPPKPQQQDQKKPLERKESVIKTNTLPNKRGSNKNNNSVRNGNKTNNNNNNNNNNSSNNNSVKNGTNSSARNSNAGSSSTNDNNKSSNNKKTNGSPRKNQPAATTTTTTTDEASTTNYETSETEAETAPVKLSDLLQPSTEAVVATTTEAVTKPLKIEAKPEVLRDSDNKAIAPMVDGRVLSATSVSNAMNKMNDSVLDTKTLMKDSGMNSKLSPAATTIISMSGNDAKSSLPAVETTNAMPIKVEERRTGGGGAMSNATNHVSDNNGGMIPARVLDQHVQNNMSKLVAPDHNNSVQKSANERLKEARTVVAADVKPIRITVKERAGDVEVQSGNVRIPMDATNGLSERPGLPPAQAAANQAAAPPAEDPPKKNACSRFFASFKNRITGGGKPSGHQSASSSEEKSKRLLNEEQSAQGCFGCAKRNKNKPDVTINIEDENGENPKFWHRFKCWGKNKVGDSTGGCCPTKRKESWSDRQDSIMSDAPPKRSRCRSFWRKVFCMDCCKSKKKPVEEDRASRRASLMSKKKSLTPSVPAEDNTPKLDMSLVEHTSTMKGAIPVLPVCLAWFCLVMNCIAPGTGTIFSGMFCLCIGIPRFSQKDGPRPRIGSFLINIVIGIGQCFTVLFCLVGWGWSIWWGIIMLRMARKHQKIKALENLEAQQAQQQPTQPASRTQRTTADQNHRDTTAS